MEITYNNCVIGVNKDFVIEEEHICCVKLGDNTVPVENLPKLKSKPDTYLYFINYGLKTYIIYKDTISNLEYGFVYEQYLSDDNISIVDYTYTVVVPKDNMLVDLITPVYNNNFENKGLELLESLLQSLSYSLVPEKVIKQIKTLLSKHQDKGSDKDFIDRLNKAEELRNNNYNLRKTFKDTKDCKEDTEEETVEETTEEEMKEDTEGIMPERMKRNQILYEGLTLKQLSKKYKIPYKTIHNRLYAQGFTIEQALELEPAPVKEKPETISSICRDLGVKPDRVFSRMSRGASFKEALDSIKTSGYVGRKEVYNGKTIKELADENGIPYATLHCRITRQHLSPEEAIKLGNSRKKGRLRNE